MDSELSHIQKFAFPYKNGWKPRQRKAELLMERHPVPSGRVALLQLTCHRGATGLSVAATASFDGHHRHETWRALEGGRYKGSTVRRTVRRILVLVLLSVFYDFNSHLL